MEENWRDARSFISAASRGRHRQRNGGNSINTFCPKLKWIDLGLRKYNGWQIYEFLASFGNQLEFAYLPVCESQSLLLFYYYYYLWYVLARMHVSDYTNRPKKLVRCVG